jgi:Ca2+-binding RTX toxin-like protein
MSIFRGIIGGLQAPSQTVHGTSGDDNVHISRASGLAGALGFYEVNINGQRQLMTEEQLEDTKFDLGSGDDHLTVASNVDARITADGGAGDDTLIGGKGNDHFDGGSGDDHLSGGDGRDFLNGGSGNDKLFGGNGTDSLIGGSGNDYLDGGKGYDRNNAGSGHNTVKFDFADYRGALTTLPHARAQSELFSTSVNPLARQDAADRPSDFVK